MEVRIYPLDLSAGTLHPIQPREQSWTEVMHRQAVKAPVQVVAEAVRDRNTPEPLEVVYKLRANSLDVSFSGTRATSLVGLL